MTISEDPAELAEQVRRLTRQVRWLMDREEIRDTKELYCRLADSGRYDEWETLFTDDFTCELNGPPMADGSPPRVLRFASKQAWMEFSRENGGKRARLDAAGWRNETPADAPRLAGTPVQRPGTAHHLHAGEIEFTGPDSARAIWPVQFDGANGFYDEEFRRVDGMWKIARERYFAQARREYADSDYPHAFECGEPDPADSRQATLRFRD